MKAIAWLLVLPGLLITALASASEELAGKSSCIACHRMEQKVLGPSFRDIAARYRSDAAAPALLMEKVREGGEGAWGDIPMPPNSTEKISDADLKTLIEWILQL